ncbi:unnamed protein product, partial [Protopolystoma xenopodis]
MRLTEALVRSVRLSASVSRDWSVEYASFSLAFWPPTPPAAADTQEVSDAGLEEEMVPSERQRQTVAYSKLVELATAAAAALAASSSSAEAGTESVRPSGVGRICPSDNLSSELLRLAGLPAPT